MTGTFASSTSRELDLVILCARPAPSAETDDQIRRLAAAGLDSNLLIAQTRRQRVLPLVHDALGRAHAQLPPETNTRLVEEMRFFTTRGLFLTSELLRVLDLFAGHGIAATPLKGPVLAVQAYGKVSRCVFRDIDIHVRPAQALDAKRVLTADAYDYKGLLSDIQEAVDLHRHRYHQQFTRREGQCEIELHSELCEWYLPYADRLDPLLEARVPVKLAGRTVSGLAPELLLLYVCVHGVKHLWRRVKLVADVAWLLHRHQDWDWDQVLATARDLRLEGALASGLHLADSLLGVAVPSAVMKTTGSHRALARTHGGVRNGLEILEERRPGAWESLRFYVRTASGATDKMRCCARYAAEKSIFVWAERPLPRVLRARPYGFLSRTRSRPLRMVALVVVAVVARGYYLLLPTAKRVRWPIRFIRRPLDR